MTGRGLRHRPALARRQLYEDALSAVMREMTIKDVRSRAYKQRAKQILPQKRGLGYNPRFGRYGVGAVPYERKGFEKAHRQIFLLLTH
jgi:hypothetical protein